MKILVVGCGYMGKEYVKVLDALNVPCMVIGRSKEGIDSFQKKFSHIDVFEGGLENNLDVFNGISHVIVATGIEDLYKHSKLVLQTGVKKVLLEKPGALSYSDLDALNHESQKKDIELFIAYNRRCYDSVTKAKQLIKKDGGVLSVFFEFTEWAKDIPYEKFSDKELACWILGNSSHVIDLAFSFTGTPQEMNSVVSKHHGYSWHPSGSIFCGSGLSVNNIPFSYHSNWESAGRWSVEVLTSKCRYYFRPMEKLIIQKKNEINSEEIELCSILDELYKPGLYNMVSKIIYNEHEGLCSIEEHLKQFPYLQRIAGY